VSAVPPEAVDAATAVLLRGGTVRDMLEAAALWMQPAATAASPAVTALAAVQSYEPEAAALLAARPAALLQVLMEAARRAVAAATPVIRAAERERCAATADIPAPGEDGAGRPRTGPSTAGTVPGGSGTPTDGSEPAETATAP